MISDKKRRKIAKKIARRKAYQKKKASRSNSRSHRTKTAGEVRFVKDDGDKGKRKIPDNYDYDHNKLTDLSDILWGLSCSLGHLNKWQGKFTKLKSIDISPDGQLGGQGYIQKINDMREDLSECIETISRCIDTIDDEVKAPHWQEEQGELSEEEQEEVEEKIEQAEEIAGDPREFAEEEFEETFGEDTSD